ncbi:Glucose-6-phosphate 1-dehydrogenase [Geodia barretti]|uniref:Glucose-6-phosphate 1-dehydrogenase n=1 Tax=Geodia barretti TaxID=519541 RepID=A0AA35WTX6_GEOBA|nr:Glucose-6-phosphate 1-dehydrogenase [Geodia barretti]
MPDQTTTIVIFGASGDLTTHKLAPALADLYAKGRLGPDIQIVGVSRTDMTADEFRASFYEGFGDESDFPPSPDFWNNLADRVHSCYGDVTAPDGLLDLQRVLANIESPDRPANRLYYLALAPFLFAPTVATLGRAGFQKEDGCWRRVVVEKPFGVNLQTAHELNEAVHQVFAEHQVYRIDHYLGKETVQNLLVFRFANAIFEPLWSRNYIDNIQITVAESVSIAERASYYDRAGVLRDMFQSHLLQLLAVVAMEPPSTFEADTLRNEKVKVLESVRHIPARDASLRAVHGQYDGYLDEPGVPPDSRTPTYAALRLDIDNWRWQGVPFYLRSGKALSEKHTEVLIQFRRPPHLIFPQGSSGDITSNTLSICLQPNEGVHLEFQAKTPDSLLDLRPVNLEFHYEDSFGGQEIPDAYERLLLDALNGDASLFIRSDEIEQSWSIMDPLIEGLSDPSTRPPEIYDLGTEGPFSADDFLARDGRAWLSKCLGG